MPNWCKNVLEISNLSKNDFDELISKYTIKEDNLERTLVFDKIIPMPRDDNGQIIEGDKGWYNFCINKWGTKWEPNTYSFEEYNDDPGYISIGMNTAWTPPLGIVKKLSELFPNAEFKIKYVEPGCCFMGEEHFVNGERTYQMYSEDLAEIKKCYPEFWEDEEDDTQELIDEKIKQDIVEDAVNNVVEPLTADENYQQEEYKGL